MTIELKGNWKKGFAYDVHTLASVYLGPDEFGHNRWDTTRSDMGELVYRLKYQDDKSATKKIIKLLGKYKGLNKMDAIIPIPSSNTTRQVQPVYEIARELGQQVNVVVLEDILQKVCSGKELKNIEDDKERKEMLQKQMTLSDRNDLKGKNVLLLDDLYRSGSTLSVATGLLYDLAEVKNVFVLTMTKTRSNR